MNMVTSFHINFKCDMEFDQQDQVDEHSDEVHGIPSPNELKTLHTIEVDAKLPFFIDQALH